MTRRLCPRGLPFILAIAFVAAAPPGWPQTCTWGGTSTVAPPQIVALRSRHALLQAPLRVAVDAASNTYTTDPSAGRVVVRDAWGRLVSVKNGLLTPTAVAVDGFGRILVAEQGAGSVSVFDRGWRLLAKLGQGDGEFQLPNDIAVDPTSGAIYLSDGAANLVKAYTADWAPLFSFGGTGRALGQFSFPAALHVSAAGEVFVADQNNDRVQVFARDGKPLRCFGGRTGGMSMSTRFGRIQGITSDGLGRIYVADAFQGYVQVFDAQGVLLLSTIGSFGDGPGELKTPVGLAIDAHNRLFVASTNNGRLEVYGLDAFSDPTLLPATVNVRPRRLRLDSERRFVTAYIELAGAPIESVEPGSLTANGVRAEARPVEIGDYDLDGVPDLMVKFDARWLLATLSLEENVIVVGGELRDGTPFEGSDTVQLLPARPHRERDDEREGRGRRPAERDDREGRDHR